MNAHAHSTVLGGLLVALGYFSSSWSHGHANGGAAVACAIALLLMLAAPKIFEVMSR